MQKVKFGHSAFVQWFVSARRVALLMTVLCTCDLADGKTSVTLTTNQRTTNCNCRHCTRSSETADKQSTQAVPMLTEPYMTQPYVLTLD